MLHISSIWVIMLCSASICCAQIYEIRQGNQWGFIDSSGQVVVPLQYDFVYGDELSHQSNGYFVFLKHQKMGVYHIDRKEIVPPIYERVKIHSDQSLPGYIEVQKNGKIGILDTLGRTILSPKYEEIKSVFPGIFAIKHDGLWGIWDPSGRFQIETAFHGFTVQQNRYIVGWQGDLYSAWDEQGQKRVTDFPDSIAFLTPHTFAYFASSMWKDSLDGLGADTLSVSEEEEEQFIGLLDSMGNVISRPFFDTVKVVRGFIYVGQKGFVGLYSGRGRKLFDFIYREINIDRRSRIWIQLESNWGLNQYRNDSLESLFPFLLTRRGRFEGNVAVVHTTGGMGVLNQYGELVVDTIYEDVFLLNGNAIVKETMVSNNRQIPLTPEGLLSNKKRLVIRTSAEQATTFIEADTDEDNDNLLPQRYGWFKQRNLWGWRDTASNRIRVMPKYTDIEVFPSLGLSLALIEIGKPEERQCALINHETGRSLILPDANINIIYMQDFASNQLARAQYSTGAFCLVDQRGAIYRLNRTAYIGPFSEGIAPACVSLIFAPLPKNHESPKPKRPKGLSGKWGYVTDQGRWGTEAKFQSLKPFTNGMGIFEFNHKWGALDTAFKEFIPPRFDEILDPAADEALRRRGIDSSNGPLVRLIATKVNTKKIFYLNEDGNLLFSKRYEASHDFHQGLVAVKVGNKWGYLNRLGQMQIEPQFDRAGDFHHGLARVRNRMRWGFINAQGDYMIESVYQLAGDFVDGIAMVKYRGKYGYLTTSGKWHIRPRFNKASDFADGRAIARASGWTGVINTKGEWVISPSYSRIWRRDNGFYRVKRKGVFGYFTADGTEQLAPHYRLISEDFKDGVAKVFTKDGWGYINENFELILEPYYRSVDTFAFQMGLVRTKNKYGVVDQKGNFVVDPTYAAIVIVNYGRFRVKKYRNSYWEDLDIRKRLPAKPFIVPQKISLFEKVTKKFGYDRLHEAHESVSVAECDQLLGLMTYDGKMLFEPQFEMVRYINGLYKVIKDGEIGYVNHRGEWVFPIAERETE
ncbi:MAG: WG repeat-containing protein [Bacteroidota bacterium]